MEIKFIDLFAGIWSTRLGFEDACKKLWIKSMDFKNVSFFINLLPMMVRMISLQASNKDKGYFYKVSQIIQVI